MAFVLIVDRDTGSATELAAYLCDNGHDVRTHGTAEELLHDAHVDRPDLIVTAMALAGMSGTELCRTVRSDNNLRAVPVIMLCDRDDEIDRVVGLEVGADDVVPKPYSLRELELRVRALLRRDRTPRDAMHAHERGAMRIDATGHRVLVGDRQIVLTALELRLLVTLHERRDRVQSRAVLLEDVWGASGGSERTVDACIKRLRKKLGSAGDAIQTVRGVGYRFADSGIGQATARTA